MSIFLPDKQMPYRITNTINIQNYGPKAMEYLEMPFTQKAVLVLLTPSSLVVAVSKGLLSSGNEHHRATPSH